MNRDAFHNLVRRILNEEITKRVPEMNGNGVDPEKKTKTFASDPNPRDKKSKLEMLDELIAAVKKVDPSFTAVWDDHDDLMINGGDMLKCWISPQWEDNFKIVFMPRNEDRFYFTGLSWPQVLEFVKENLSPDKRHTAVEIARDRSWRNAKDQTDKASKDLPQKDKPKIMSTDEPFTKEKNREKRYVEDEVKKKDDLPDKPMKEVGETKKQGDHKVKDPVRLRKRNPDTKLVVKQK